LGDPDAVRRILDSAGFADVTFDEVRASVYYGSDVDAAFEFRLRIRDGAGNGRTPRRRSARSTRWIASATCWPRTGRADGVWFDSRAWIVAARRL